MACEREKDPTSEREGGKEGKIVLEHIRDRMRVGRRKDLLHDVGKSVTLHEGGKGGEGGWCVSPLCVCGTPDVVLTEVRPSHVYCPSGSADAILALINAGASVSADDKDGLTGESTWEGRGQVRGRGHDGHVSCHVLGGGAGWTGVIREAGLEGGQKSCGLTGC